MSTADLDAILERLFPEIVAEEENAWADMMNGNSDMMNGNSQERKYRWERAVDRYSDKMDYLRTLPDEVLETL